MSDPVPGTPEYDAAMIAKAEAGGITLNGEPLTPSTPATPATPAVADKPAGVPDKFWDAATGTVRYEAWAQSTAELESKFTKQQQESKPPLADPTKPPVDPAKPTETPATPALADVMKLAADEYSTTKTLSEETLTKLEGAGVPRSTAQVYMDGLAAQAELTAVKIYGAAGGEDEYKSMLEWATANMTPAQTAAYNAAMDTGKMDTIVGAVQNLKSMYATAQGSAPSKRIEGENGGATPGGGYRSSAEMVAAMADPKYGKDTAYTADVQKRVALMDAANMGIVVRDSGRM